MANRPAIARYEELISEADAVRRFAMLLGARELRKARQNGEIVFVMGKKGKPFYHPDDLAAYLSRKEHPAMGELQDPKDFGPQSRTKRTIPPAAVAEGEHQSAARIAEKFSQRIKDRGQK
ncbi:MAG: hypothetical protein RIB97_01060 [Nitratireductor sp.]